VYLQSPGMTVSYRLLPRLFRTLLFLYASNVALRCQMLTKL
jgi:hypothetical protein